jgi:hypothetical protein
MAYNGMVVQLNSGMHKSWCQVNWEIRFCIVAVEEDIWQSSVILLSNRHTYIYLVYLITETCSSIDKDSIYKIEIVVFLRQ